MSTPEPTYCRGVELRDFGRQVVRHKGEPKRTVYREKYFYRGLEAWSEIDAALHDIPVPPYMERWAEVRAKNAMILISAIRQEAWKDWIAALNQAIEEEFNRKKRPDLKAVRFFREWLQAIEDGDLDSDQPEPE